MMASDIEMKNDGSKRGRILLEFGTITLLDEVSSKRLTELEIMTILRDISQGLKEIHSLGICHFDLKP